LLIVSSQVGQEVGICGAGTEFDRDASATDVAEVVELFLERSYPGLGTGYHSEESDAGNLRSRLRLRGERRGEEGAGHSRDERPPVHHSMTWSA
jgi:hypothetical protein